MEVLETAIVKVKKELAAIISIEAAQTAEEEEQLSPAAEALAAQAPATGERPTTATMDSIKIAASKLDALLLQAEEMLAVKRATIQHAAESLSLLSDAESWNKEFKKIDQPVRVIEQFIDRSGNISLAQAAPNIQKVLEFLDWNHTRIGGLVARLKSQAKLVGDDMRSASSTVDTFLDSTKQLLMMPCAALFQVFPKLVRDVARDLGKEVDFSMQGVEIELDRRILAQLRDPLVHLLRNAIDHGIDTPEERQAAGKTACARLTLTVSQADAGMVEIVVADDGKGVDPERVKASAIKQSVISESEATAMSKEEAINLIFQSSLSTAKIITEISGRGLGLAIVKENIGNLGGKLVVDTEIGKGTAFRMLLPVTVATFTGVLLEVRNRIVTIPKARLSRVVRVHAHEIKTVAGRDVFALNGTIVPLVRLADLLEIPQVEGEDEYDMLLVAVAFVQDSLLGLIVDEILEEQDVLVKNLGRPLLRVRNVSGVTILRTGEAVPVLNVADLGKSAKRAVGKSGGLAGTLQEPRRKKRILVVDDTITSRMLMKNIMEAAGYEARTATDGIEAFATLTQALGDEPFDLMLCDVEMPRMNGLELTKRLRQDSQLQDLPIVLLTSLGSKEDRERGVQAGANAYFVKSSGFDQSSLLGVIKRLV
jgi:two-component system chemotaxis sensor kinase CheA